MEILEVHLGTLPQILCHRSTIRRSMCLMGQVELALGLLADFVSVMSQRWKELALNVVT
jgi:hypothetical protein